MTPVSSSSGAIESFGLLKKFWMALVYVFMMMMPCGCNSLLVIFEKLLVYDSVIFNKIIYCSTA